MKITCAALYPITRYGFPYKFDDYLKAVAELRSVGFDACELEINVDVDLNEYMERRNEVQARLRETEMSLSALIAVVAGGFSMNPEVGERYYSRFEQVCQFAENINCDTVCICAYMPPDVKGVPGTESYRGAPPMQIVLPPHFAWAAFWDNAVARFAQMARAAARHGLRLVIENRVGDFVSTSDGVLNLIVSAGEANAGCLLDVAHVHASREHLSLVIHKLRHHLRYVHLADNDGSAPHHLPVGQGTIDFPSVLEDLRAVGYDDYIGVDYGGVPKDEILGAVGNGLEYFTQLLAPLHRQSQE